MQRTLLCFVATVLAGSGSAHADGAGDAKPVRLTLEQVIDKSLANPLAQMARHKTSAARAQADEARGARYPRLEVTSFLAPSPKIECVDAGCTSTEPTDVTVNIAGVFGGVRAQLTQPLYTFGKLSSIGNAARKAADASELLEHHVAGDLVHKAAQTYYGLKLARELVWMLEDGKEEISKGQKTLEKRLAEGSPDVTIQDRMRLQTLVAEVDARLTEAKEAEAGALAALRALTGVADADIDEDLLRAVSFQLGADPDDYVQRANRGRSDVRAAEAGVDATSALVSYEKARYLPDLVLIGGVNFARAQGVDDAPSAFSNDPFNTLGAQLGLVLRWKIDPGSQPARVARVRAENRRAGALLSAARAGATFEVKRAHAKANQAQKRLQASKKGEKAAKGWVASVVQADAIGAASAKDLADALVAYFTLKGRVLQSTYDWNLATVGLRKAVGEFKAPRARP